MPRRRPPRIDPSWTEQHTLTRPWPMQVWLIIPFIPMILTGIAYILDRWL